MPSVKQLMPLHRPPSLHVTVQESLRGYIKDNPQAGGPMPPEAFLAQQLGVSRNSVREGIKALELLGILETRRGVGVFVKAFSFEPLLDNLAYGLGGALRQIEELGDPPRPRDRAYRQNDRDDQRRGYRRVAPGHGAHAPPGRAQRGFVEEDKQFHRLLFRCQENEMLSGLIEVFWLAFYKASDFVNLEKPNPMATWRDHHEIVDAVEARDLEEPATSRQSLRGDSRRDCAQQKISNTFNGRKL